MKLEETQEMNENVDFDGANNKESEGTEHDEKKHKKSAASKKAAALSEKEKEIEKIRNELEQWRENYLRKAAEFENYRKRKERENAEIWKIANIELIKKFLPILDDLERSLAAADSNKDLGALVKGLELIVTAFMKVLEGEGVQQISAKDQPFDPEYHQALLQIQQEGVASNIVVDEHQKGYVLGDRVIRPAQVVVSK